MSTITTPVSGLSLRNNIFLKGLNQPEFSELIYSEDYGFNRLTQLMDRSLQGKPAVPIKDNKIWIPKMGNVAVAAVVGATSTISGDYLVVTFAQSDNRFRKSEIVSDSNGVRGLIVSRTDNSVTLAATRVAWDATIHFVKDSRVAVADQASPIGDSTGLTSNTYMPDKDYALLHKMRNSWSRNTNDNVKTVIHTSASGKYWCSSQQKWMVRVFSNMEENRLMWSERCENIQTPDGPVNTTGGIYWTGRYNGGNYMPVTENWDEDSLNAFVKLAKSKFPTGAGNLPIGVGKQALQDLQKNVFKSQIVFNGELNTFGGKKVVGYNAFTYGIGGTLCDFYELPILNNTKSTGSAPKDISTVTNSPKNESMLVCVDFTPTPSEDGGADVPTIQRFRREGIPELAMRYNPGMNLFDSEDMAVEGKDVKTSTSDLDRASWEMYKEDGYFIIPEKVTIGELTK